MVALETRHSHRDARGFSLIELMIAVAVVAILAAVAYPSYQNQVRRSHRSAAQSFLMAAAARQSQRFVDVRSYADSLATLGMPAPGEVAGRYAIDVVLVAGPPPTFTLRAAPQGAQSADSCGILSVTSAGVRSPANCW